MLPKLPLGPAAADLVEGVTERFATELRGVSDALGSAAGAVCEALIAAPPLGLAGGLAALAWLIRRDLKTPLLVAAGLLLVQNLGYWRETLETLVLVGLSAGVAMALGVPLGILAARHPRFDAALRPALDLMQTIPTFVYLIPTLMLFGLGLAPGIVSTVVFALPAPLRLTTLGIRGVPPALTEVADAFGASAWQRLVKVELPHALPSIRAGASQCIMLSLSMVVIAALVGADGLGKPVVQALNTVDVGKGFEAGLVIVIVAVLLDRTLAAERRA